jgi:translation initiation factor IF-3
MVKKYKDHKATKLARINQEITAPKVRLINDGVNMGIMESYKAKSLAFERELDLVEVSPDVSPPVCSIMDYGKFRYEQQKKSKNKEVITSAKSTKIKIVQLSPVIGDGDLATKANKARGFLDEGMKVQITLRFKRRQNAHKDVGFEVIKAFMSKLEDVATMDMEPKLQGNTINCRIERKKKEK